MEWGEAGEVVVVAMAGEAGEVGRSAADVTQGVGEDRRHHTGRLMGGSALAAWGHKVAGVAWIWAWGVDQEEGGGDRKSVV